MRTEIRNALMWRGINPPFYGSKKTTCPVCSERREKRDERCLSVYDKGAWVEWKCHHCGWEDAEVAA